LFKPRRRSPTRPHRSAICRASKKSGGIVIGTIAGIVVVGTIGIIGTIIGDRRSRHEIAEAGLLGHIDEASLVPIVWSRRLIHRISRCG
jgi:hypothetical protein